jgi:hypothetical protein
MTAIFSMLPAGKGQDSFANGKSCSNGFGGTTMGPPEDFFLDSISRNRTAQSSVIKSGKISLPVHQSVFAIRLVRISAAMPLKSIYTRSVLPLVHLTHPATHAT